MQDNANQIAPLSADLELRRPGTDLVSVNQFLGPRVETFVNQLASSLERLRELAEEARRSENRPAEAAILAKFIDQVTKILKLARFEGPNNQRHQTAFGPTYSQLPVWNNIPESARKLLEMAFAEIEKAE